MKKPKVVHCKRDKYDVYIGRPQKWGNPFTHIANRQTQAKYLVGSREEAVEAYRKWITEGEGKYLLQHLGELKGKVLGCWCAPKACHGDVLLELANSDDVYEYVDVPRRCIESTLEICPRCHDTKTVSTPLQTIKLSVDPPYRTECSKCKIYWTTYRTEFKK